MEIDKVFNNGIDGVADNLFSAVNNSVSEIKAMQQRKAAENVQLVIQALKKIDSDIRSRYDEVGNAIEKRVATIKDGRDGINGKDGKNGKDGRDGKQGVQGTKGQDGINGRDGVDGVDGVSVTSAHIDFDGSLIIGLSSGVELNVGEVLAPSLAESIKVITNGGGTSQSVIDSIASLQAQITAMAGFVNYEGTWNASTNIPTLTSSVGTKGDYYVVSTTGSTNLNGVTTWTQGDWAIFNGSVWEKVDNTDLVTSVAGRTGAITLANTDISGFGTMSTQNASSVAVTGGTINGTTIGATTPAAGTFTSITDSGNLTFTGTGNRITGDFSNATIANRVSLQNSVVNGASIVQAIPNGTGTTSGFSAFNNSDPTNAANIVTFASSTEARVSSGITGTGTYLPLTMYTGGSERLRIDTSGNVGIGTASPTTSLQIYNATSATLQVDGDAGALIRATRYSTDTNAPTCQIRKARGTFASPTAVASGDTVATYQASAYGGTSYRAVSQIQGVVDTYTSDTNISGYLTFSTNVGSTAVTERMRITSAGDVSVASANAGARTLSVYNSDTGAGSYSQMYIQTNAGYFIQSIGSTANGALSSVYSTGSGGMYQYTVGAYPLYFGTNSTERMRIDSSGNVLVGTTGNPAAAKFFVAGTSAFGTAAAPEGQLTSDGTNAYLDARLTGGGLIFRTNGSSERMRINSSGNVGIGNNSPSVKLDILGTDPTVRVANNAGGYEINIGVDSSNLGWTGSTNGTAWGVKTNNTERMRIDTSGNVGIGTSSPNASAILDAQSTTKGVRFPNMTTTQKNAISSPAAGLVVFDTTLSKLAVYSGTAWQTITSV